VSISSNRKPPHPLTTDNTLTLTPTCAKNNAEPGAAGALSSSLDLEDWDGVGPAGALWSGGALSSLPYREDDGAGGAGAGGGAAAAAGGGAAGGGAPGAPSYRGGGAAAAPDARAPRTYGAAALPTLGLLGAAPAPTAEAAALEDFLRERAVDAAMVLHHAAAEADLNRYAGTMRLAALLEAVEQEDVRLGAAPMLPGTGQKVPSWIRAREALHPELPALHAAQVAAEAAASAAAVRAARERLLDEVAAAAALLAETRPAAGLARDDATAAAAEADLTLDDLMMDVLPGAAPAPDDGSDFLDELVPGGGHFPLSAADIEALSGEGPGGRRRGGAAAAARTARADALEAAHRGDSALESAEGEGEGEGASSAAEESEVEAEGEGLAEEMADADADAEAILE
jgi:hypothetical protein